MTDKLTEIINSKRMFDDTTLFNTQTDKLCREIAKEYAAHEVDRLLDYLGHWDTRVTTFANKGFSWESLDYIAGDDKPSLLKHVGYTNEQT